MRDIQVFSKEWFIKHQKPLLWFANTKFGRRLLRIHGTRSSVGKAKITKILPNAIFWDNQAEFRIHDKFAKRLYYGLKPLWFLLHGWDFMFGQKVRQLNFGFDTLLAQPVAGANSPVDGMVRRHGVDEAFATIRAGAGTSSAVLEDTRAFGSLNSSTTSNQYQELTRSIFCFDTSSIGTTSVISSAVFSVSGVDKDQALGTPSFHLTSATPASTSTLASSDYANVGSTSFASISYSDALTISTANFSYSQFALSANGLANINKTGISKFAGRISWDMTGDTTGLNWASTVGSYWTVNFADQTGTSKDPKLLVFYKTVGTPTIRREAFFDGLSFNTISGVSVLSINTYDPAKRRLNIYEIAHGQRSKATSGFYNKKTITIKVGITGGTRMDAEQSLDSLLSSLHGLEKELVIDQGRDGRRVYTASLVDTVIQEGGGSYIEVGLVFECSDPFGYELTSTLALVIDDLTTQYLVFEGGAPTQVPLITIAYASITMTGATGTVSVGNLKTAQTVTVTRVWATGDVLRIDCRNKTVTVNNVEVAFSGAIPEWTSNELGFMTYDDDFISGTITSSSSVTYNKRYT